MSKKVIAFSPRDILTEVRQLNQMIALMTISTRLLLEKMSKKVIAFSPMAIVHREGALVL